MNYDKKNIFAKILNNELPSKKVYEDKYVLAFHDINPLAPVHILVIPKGAYISMTDFIAKAGHEEIAGFFQALSCIVKQMGIERDGYRVITNAGVNGGQEVAHFHVHLLGGRRLGPILVNQGC